MEKEIDYDKRPVNPKTGRPYGFNTKTYQKWFESLPTEWKGWWADFELMEEL